MKPILYLLCFFSLLQASQRYEKVVSFMPLYLREKYKELFCAYQNSIESRRRQGSFLLEALEDKKQTELHKNALFVAFEAAQDEEEKRRYTVLEFEDIHRLKPDEVALDRVATEVALKVLK